MKRFNKKYRIILFIISIIISIILLPYFLEVIKFIFLTNSFPFSRMKGALSFSTIWFLIILLFFVAILPIFSAFFILKTTKK
jgi:hypothetical protein